MDIRVDKDKEPAPLNKKEEDPMRTMANLVSGVAKLLHHEQHELPSLRGRVTDKKINL